MLMSVTVLTIRCNACLLKHVPQPNQIPRHASGMRGGIGKTMRLELLMLFDGFGYPRPWSRSSCMQADGIGQKHIERD